MNTFNSLPLAERQAKVNALLADVTKRLPLRVRRNAKVMGALVKTVWAKLKADSRVTRTALARLAREMDLTACQSTH